MERKGKGKTFLSCFHLLLFPFPEDMQGEIHIESERTGEVPGTHIITYQSGIDSIEIKHEAHNRQGFALGAVLAAEWIKDKKGVFSMSDMLNL